MSDFAKFEHRSPAHQNAVDILQGKWACNLAQICPGLVSGEINLYKDDNRPRLAGNSLGNGEGRFDGMAVLELGPLEGAHTYQIERLGAKSILAIEANVEAFLKCLIVKEIAGLQKAKFLLGDFVEYLSDAPDKFDMVFCSGVLYHMVDPINLIRLINMVTDKVFVWTHYYEPGVGEHRVPRKVNRFGLSLTYYELEYRGMNDGKFWGGNKPVAAWLEKEAITHAFQHFGYSKIDIVEESPKHPNGPAFSLAVSRLHR